MNRYGDMIFFLVIIPTPGMNVQGLLVHSRRVTEGNYESVRD